MMSLPSLGGTFSFEANGGVLPFVSMLTTAGSTFFAISAKVFATFSGWAVNVATNIPSKLKEIKAIFALYCRASGRILLMDITLSYKYSGECNFKRNYNKALMVFSNRLDAKKIFCMTS